MLLPRNVVNDGLYKSDFQPLFFAFLQPQLGNNVPHHQSNQASTESKVQFTMSNYKPTGMHLSVVACFDFLLWSRLKALPTVPSVPHPSSIANMLYQSTEASRRMVQKTSASALGNSPTERLILMRRAKRVVRLAAVPVVRPAVAVQAVNSLTARSILSRRAGKGALLR